MCQEYKLFSKFGANLLSRGGKIGDLITSLESYLPECDADGKDFKRISKSLTRNLIFAFCTNGRNNDPCLPHAIMKNCAQVCERFGGRQCHP